MRVLFHPEFPRDVKRFQSEYRLISIGLANRFRQDIDDAIEAIKSSPTTAGHFLNIGSTVVREFRRRNLQGFPFFVLYGCHQDQLLIGSLIPSRSDPLTWLSRFSSL